MAEQKNPSHFTAVMVTIIALRYINMHNITHASATIQADEAGYATT
ncbi:hypothetical protein DYY67_0200 [Candidatus Nitrosotalea sp. TS]|nr:hypothetical protein [Candidatus Nitrosotalea sp. TS]NHI03079.1 hypothetical protein [Candidatus Nitrosotalea sp. TS]